MAQTMFDGECGQRVDGRLDGRAVEWCKTRVRECPESDQTTILGEDAVG